MNDKISIIVPVYNVEKYIGECVHSLCKQTYRDIEIILVDDGSTDRSGQMCDDLSKRDNRINVYHTENRGTWSARKLGVLKATGSYIGFVDGDDWIDNNMYESLYNLAVKYNASIVTSAGIREYANGSAGSLFRDGFEEGIYTQNEIMEHIFPVGIDDKKYINGNACYKFFRRNSLIKALEKIEEKLYLYEDLVLCVAAILEADRIYIHKGSYYHHRERAGSSTYRRDIHILEQLSKAYELLLLLFEKSDYEGLLTKQLDEFMAHTVFRSLPRFLGSKYYFPSYIIRENNSIPKNAKIILYGAGTVGQGYKWWNDHSGWYQIVQWVDKCNYNNEEIVDFRQMQNIEYEYVLIAVKNQGLAMEIKSELICFGIDAEKIIWLVPKSFSEIFVNKIVPCNNLSE